MKKIFLALAVVVLMTISSASVYAISGKGTISNPYIISTQKDLDFVNDFPNLRFVLGNDIELSGTWVPLCDGSGDGFTGVFDGQGYTISNLTTEGSYGGLFRNNKGTIKNVNVVIAESGTTGTSGLVYFNNGTISDCVVKGNIVSETDYVGGICSRNNNTINKCKFEGNVESTKKNSTIYVGGISGYNDNKISASAVIGNVKADKARVGGIAGYNSYGSSIINCYFIGELKNGVIYCGGITGTNDYYYDGSLGSLTPAKVTDCYAVPKGATYGISFNGNSNTSSTYCGRITTSYYDKEVSGLVGDKFGTPKSTVAMKMKETYEKDWDFENTWGINENINGGYPYLLWEYPEGVEEEEIIPYTLNSTTITDVQGNKLDSIPQGQFFFEIDVTKNTDSVGADCLVIAVYDENGAFTDVKYMKGTYNVNQNIQFGAMLDGKTVGSIKAFIWNSTAGLTPLSNAVSFAN